MPMKNVVMAPDFCVYTKCVVRNTVDIYIRNTIGYSSPSSWKMLTFCTDMRKEVSELLEIHIRVVYRCFNCGLNLWLYWPCSQPLGPSCQKAKRIYSICNRSIPYFWRHRILLTFRLSTTSRFRMTRQSHQHQR